MHFRIYVSLKFCGDFLIRQNCTHYGLVFEKLENYGKRLIIINY